ncbi:Calcium-dependent protein kinase 5 (PbCDPK5) [Durusdinium trenchii]|uniref:Calcium-dependent protein kinase 5 (PbCDPK5) n=1 Tax=Durusdinium trenchii TaxID=1381693 RepID=A0ABP0QST4_9DINO
MGGFRTCPPLITEDTLVVKKCLLDDLKQGKDVPLSELQLQRAPAALDVRPELRGAGEGDEEGLQSLVNQESEFVREGSQEFSDAALSDLGSLSSGDDSDDSLIDPEQGDIDFHPHFIQLATGYGRIHKPGEGVLADKPACNAVGKRFTRLVLDEDWGTGYDLCERCFGRVQGCKLLCDYKTQRKGFMIRCSRRCCPEAVPGHVSPEDPDFDLKLDGHRAVALEWNIDPPLRVESQGRPGVEHSETQTLTNPVIFTPNATGEGERGEEELPKALRRVVVANQLGITQLLRLDDQEILDLFVLCRDGGAFKRYVPGPKTGGFARGSFIAWRRHERVRDEEGNRLLRTDSIRELYDFAEVVGEGGFGTVLRARHRRTGEVVAIKSIAKSQLKDEEALQLEVAFLKMSDHPNTVRYYETFEDAHDIHLVMEMCSGGSLAQYIQNAHEDFGPGVSEDELARITLQMLQGIAYCHAHSVAHRDIKPQNLLFSCGAPKTGSAIPISCSGHGDAPLKLVDFGIAGVLRNDRPEKRLLTKCAGTVGYMAPEVFGSRPYDGRSADLFSIGAVMHHMIVGVPPSWKSATNTYEFPGKVRYMQLSEDCQSLMEHLLHEEPEMRPTAAEALQHPWFDRGGFHNPRHGPVESMADLLERCFRRMHDFCQRTQLQKTIMYSMVAFAGLHNHHMEELRTAFLVADRGKSAGVSCFEFVELGRK